MLSPCSEADTDAILEIVNDAATSYLGVIPLDFSHEPYMSREELDAEIAAGVSFSGFLEGGVLVGVMGIQHVSDVTLIRHAYVRSSHQRRGIGAALLAALRTQAGEGTLLVGTWAGAHWAIDFYERNGFRLQSAAETERLLSTYWDIPTPPGCGVRRVGRRASVTVNRRHARSTRPNSSNRRIQWRSADGLS
jgi:GNAT superfamily N-acetyltransferase